MFSGFVLVLMFPDLSMCTSIYLYNSICFLSISTCLHPNALGAFEIGTEEWCNLCQALQCQFPAQEEGQWFWPLVLRVAPLPAHTRWEPCGGGWHENPLHAGRPSWRACQHASPWRHQVGCRPDRSGQAFRRCPFYPRPVGRALLFEVGVFDQWLCHFLSPVGVFFGVSVEKAGSQWLLGSPWFPMKLIPIPSERSHLPVCLQSKFQLVQGGSP